MTEAEAAFRALKSELAIRPVFHQLERRVKAHVLVAFLGYALWVTLKHQLRRRGTGLSPTQALAHLATLQSADIVLPTTDGRKIRLRRVAKPTSEQQRLLDQLEITIPVHLEWNAESGRRFRDELGLTREHENLEPRNLEPLNQEPLESGLDADVPDPRGRSGDAAGAHSQT